MTTAILKENQSGGFVAFLGTRMVGEIIALGPLRYCWRTFLPTQGSARTRFRIVKGLARAKFGLLLSIERWLRDAGLRPKRVAS